jgi:hypothetical protein
MMTENERKLLEWARIVGEERAAELLAERVGERMSVAGGRGMTGCKDVRSTPVLAIHGDPDDEGLGEYVGEWVKLSTLVEECCAGALVGVFGESAGYPRLIIDGPHVEAVVPIANAPPSLLEVVARELLVRYSAPDRLRGCGLIGVPAAAPLFAAAWHEAGGVCTWVLVSSAHAGINVRALASLYQPTRPWRDEDTPRVARLVMPHACDDDEPADDLWDEPISGGAQPGRPNGDEGTPGASV